jgi:hypothetical protein
MSREVRKRAIYDSCRILAPSGELMCLVAEKRARWYVARGLGRVTAEDPLTVVLCFEPRGKGHAGDFFYTTARPNACAGCGGTAGLTLHHIVPHCYRRYFPAEVKDHSCHDLVPLCLDCHYRYEASAQELKQELAQEFSAPLAGVGRRYDAAMARARRAASALERHARGEAGVRIPPARLEALREVVRSCLGVAAVDAGAIARACRLDPHVAEDGSKTHGEMVVAAVPDLQAFVERWRRHFLASLNPPFLPAGWRVDREIGK